MFHITLWFSCWLLEMQLSCVWLPSGDLKAVLSLGIDCAFLSTCGFPLTMWLLEVWIQKPLHTPLLCGRETVLKIGRFGGSKKPSLCEVLKNTPRSIDTLFTCRLSLSVINLNKPVTVVTQMIWNNLCSASTEMGSLVMMLLTYKTRIAKLKSI